MPYRKVGRAEVKGWPGCGIHTTPGLGTPTYLDLDHVPDAVYNEQMVLAAGGRAEEADVACWPPEVRIVCMWEKRIAGRVNIPVHEAGRGNLDLAHFLESFNLISVIVFQSDADARKHDPTRAREDVADI